MTSADRFVFFVIVVIAWQTVTDNELSAIALAITLVAIVLHKGFQDS